MTILNKILTKLNIKLDENQKWIALSTFIFGLINTYINPTITKEIISNLPAEYLAVEALVMSATSLFIGMLWQGKIRKTAINNFMLLIAIESLAAFCLSMWLTFVSYNVWVFAIASLIYSSLISIFVGKCIMAFKTKLWQDEGREIYDNNASMIGGITCIIGYATALLFLPGLKFSVFIWGCSCLLDNIAWGYVYYKNRNKLYELYDNLIKK